ncbi:MAG: type II toxin-antitoxin system PemK/MazF family toxin [Spirochaeta sp.]|jgi:mRNA-degrading endonuclease toxin of MazEF toxin-antitoxin module|nr:type II toxin-antitoxin system PemK/MazF family toxin [Spirochaeta sp.]
MKKQWEMYATDAMRNTTVLVISSDVVNELFPYVTVIPVVPWEDGREVYPIEALVPGVFSSGAGAAAGDVAGGAGGPAAGGVGGSSVALVHQIRTLKADRLTERRGAVEDEAARRGVREAMIAYFGL